MYLFVVVFKSLKQPYLFSSRCNYFEKLFQLSPCYPAFNNLIKNDIKIKVIQEPYKKYKKILKSVEERGGEFLPKGNGKKKKLHPHQVYSI